MRSRLAAAVAVCARKFLLGLSERFIRLPPSAKVVLVAAVAVATAVAQKTTNVTMDSHGLIRIEAGEEPSTDYTDYHGLTRIGERSAALNACAEETQSVSEGTFAGGEPEGGASRREELEEGRRGEERESLAAKSAKSAKADEAPLPQDTSDFASSASFAANDISALSTPLQLNTAKQTPRLLSSITSALSDSNLSLASFTLLFAIQTSHEAARRGGCRSARHLVSYAAYEGKSHFGRNRA